MLIIATPLTEFMTYLYAEIENLITHTYMFPIDHMLNLAIASFGEAGCPKEIR